MSEQLIYCYVKVVDEAGVERFLQWTGWGDPQAVAADAVRAYCVGGLVGEVLTFDVEPLRWDWSVTMKPLPSKSDLPLVNINRAGAA